MPIRSRLIELLSISALSATLAYAAFQEAGIHPPDWNFSMAAVGIVAGIYGLWTPADSANKLNRVCGVCILAILGLVSAQLLPLPIWIVRFISPMRSELGEAAARLTRHPVDMMTLTATPYDGLQFLLTLFGYFAVILLVRRLVLRMRDKGWFAVWPLLLVSVCEALLACWQSYAGEEKAHGTYVNPDHFAGLIEMSLPLALVYGLARFQGHYCGHDWTSRPPLRALISFLIFGLFLAGIVVSLCRSAFIASLASIFVVMYMLVSARPWEEGPLATLQRWPRWIPVSGAIVVTVLSFLYLQTNSLGARFADLAGSEGVTGEMRLQIWSDTFKLIRDYPLIGCGLGAFGSCFLRYKTVAPMGTIDYAHNDYLQVIAELGIFGFLAGVVLVFRFVRGAFEAASKARSAQDRFIAIGCLGAMSAILLHSFTDFNMYVPANGFAFAWIAGMALALADQGSESSSGQELPI